MVLQKLNSSFSINKKTNIDRSVKSLWSAGSFFVCFMVFTATFNLISVLLVDTGGPGENHCFLVNGKT
jgi:hypothetical protein